MADAVNTYASPREYKRHQRYAKFTQLRHSKQAINFLSTEAARLGTTEAEIFSLLDSFTADQIRAAASLGAL